MTRNAPEATKRGGWRRFLVLILAFMRKAGVDQSVIIKLTGPKTAAVFQRYNTVDTADAKEAYRKLEGFLDQDHGAGFPGNLGPGKKVLP